MKSTEVFGVFFILSILIFFTSCDYLPFFNKEKIQEIDTIIDVTSVDLYPSFPECDSLVDQQKKANCFRKTIHQKIGEDLSSYQFSAKDSINETILVDIIVNAKGEIIFDGLQASEKIENQLPELDSLVKISVSKLPKIVPANKRGIPVTTKYQLPIEIKLEN